MGAPSPAAPGVSLARLDARIEIDPPQVASPQRKAADHREQRGRFGATEALGSGDLPVHLDQARMPAAALQQRGRPALPVPLRQSRAAIDR